MATAPHLAARIPTSSKETKLENPSHVDHVKTECANTLQQVSFREVAILQSEHKGL